MDTSAARQVNRGQVMKALIADRGLSRSELSELTKLSKATIARVVEELLLARIVKEGPPLANARRGPSPAVLELDIANRAVIGVDVGATNTRLVVTDLLGRRYRFWRRTTSRSAAGSKVADWLIRLARDATADLGRGVTLAAMSVGIPGIVQPDGSGITGAENLPAIEGLDFLRAMDESAPCLAVFNDVNLAVLGEMALGSAAGHRSGVMITIGTGVGGGVVLNERPFLGSTGRVGEFGYLLIPLPGGGHAPAQDLIGAKAIVERAAQLGITVESPAAVLAHDSPRALVQLRTSILDTVVTVLSAVTAAYEPEIIVVGGGMAPSLAPWLETLRASVAGSGSPTTAVALSSLGDAAGTLGAAIDAWTTAMCSLGIPADGLAELAADRLQLLKEKIKTDDTQPLAIGTRRSSRSQDSPRQASGRTFSSPGTATGRPRADMSSRG